MFACLDTASTWRTARRWLRFRISSRPNIPAWTCSSTTRASRSAVRSNRLYDEDFEWLFEINFWGVVRMTRAFLPLLRASEDARVVNLSSVYGLVAPPEQAAYSASKFAVRGFSEALRHELEGSGVGVSVVHPGGIATSIAEKARVPAGTSEEEIARRRERYRKLLRLPPEIAGETIVRGIERREARVLVGSDAKTISLIARLLPVSYWKLLTLRLRQ